MLCYALLLRIILQQSKRAQTLRDRWMLHFSQICAVHWSNETSSWKQTPTEKTNTINLTIYYHISKLLARLVPELPKPLYTDPWHDAHDSLDMSNKPEAAVSVQSTFNIPICGVQSVQFRDTDTINAKEKRGSQKLLLPTLLLPILMQIMKNLWNSLLNGGILPCIICRALNTI